MARGSSKLGLPRACQQWLGNVTANLRKDSIWQPMLKNVLSTTITLTIGVIPAVVAVYGRSTYLGAMAAVFGQPGQRFGQMAEALSLMAVGTLLGLAWGDLGLYLSSLVYVNNVNAAWAIRAVFFTLGVIFHGLLRSLTPRLFLSVYFFTLINLSILTNASTAISVSATKAVVYPVFTAIGVMILVNITVFPQFSSSFLGTSTTETLTEVIDSFQAAGNWFMSGLNNGSGENKEETSPEVLHTRLATLTDKKLELRTRLGSCEAAQAECNFELVFAVLPPRSLKPISVTMMARLVQITIYLINACESKFALAAYEDNGSGTEKPKEDEAIGIESDSSHDEKTAQHQRNIDLIKPLREIESGDIDLLEHIMSQIRHPAKAMQDQIEEAVRLITSALAYCYDVPKLPSGATAPNGIILEEMDIRMEIFTKALSQFDLESAAALGSAAATTYGRDLMGDIAPRMETHLISSFLISISQAAGQVLEMLKYARTLVERRQSRNNRRRLYWPRISWKKWLTTGGERDGNVLPENARKEARAGYGLTEDSRDRDDEGTNTRAEALRRPKHDEETGEPNCKKGGIPQGGKIPHRKGPQKLAASNILWIRGLVADVFEFFLDSDDLAFALKMTVAALLVTWPAFVPPLNAWYVSVRGTWATMQLILVFEVSVGTSFRGFFLRALGTVFGCSIGIIAYEIGQGNLVVLVIVLTIGLLPASYVHLATSYVKAGTICAVSLSVVGLATVVRANNDYPWQVYLKRMICFLIGGTVALLLEIALFPVRARDRLVESLASSIEQISIMESSVAVGVDSPSNIDVRSHASNATFKSAKEKAEQALSAARTFLPFCLTEPRLKGSFRGQVLIYGEMIYVLFQIIERMDNMLHIRKLYGSSVLEELQAEVLPYRRNVAGSVALTLFAVHEALTTRLPLPQFLPSSRVAQLRFIARVRELLLEPGSNAASRSGAEIPAATMSPQGCSAASNTEALESMTRRNFLAWSATSAGMMEIIEYLEELVDLAKLLVGVNAFRSGMLERPKFREYIAKIKARESEAATSRSKPLESEKSKDDQAGGRRRRLASFGRRSSIAQSTASFGGSLRRRQSATTRPAVAGDATLDSDNSLEGNDIPWNLRRVMTKGVEGSERLTRLERRESEDPKGKRGLRGAKTGTE
ncbi:hypothetical protein F5Y19DRAFT_82868 [Xylariaceae sp. FL1651]|nr:hypothetical protein F5Y19DRAFT_82868 [Xylariaceae sp. FL1651]